MSPPRRDSDPELLSELSSIGGPDRYEPAADVFETEKAIVVQLDVAGVRSGDVKVTVDGPHVHVRGVRRAPSTEEIQHLHRMEIPFGPFRRTIDVGIPFERDRVSAHLEDGILTVTLPKRLPAQVPVRREGGPDESE